MGGGTVSHGQCFKIIILSVFLVSCSLKKFRSTGGSASEDFFLTKTCQSLDVDMISNILRYQLGFVEGDVPMVDESGNHLKSSNCKSYKAGGSGAQDCYYLNTFEKELQDTSCVSSKLKVVSEIFINACVISIEDPVIDQRLFPQGVSNYDDLYLYMTGRIPATDEIQILDELSASISDDKEKKQAICATVSSSFAAVSIN